jgi:hypothetical protein
MIFYIKQVYLLNRNRTLHIWYSCHSNNLNQLQLFLIYHQSEKGKPSKNGFAIIEKPMSTMKNLRSVMILYTVLCRDYPDGLETEIVVKITF